MEKLKNIGEGILSVILFIILVPISLLFVISCFGCFIIGLLGVPAGCITLIVFACQGVISGWWCLFIAVAPLVTVAFCCAGATMQEIIYSIAN